VVLLGDGACDGTRLQQVVQDAGWSSVCRRVPYDGVVGWGDLSSRYLGACIKPGTLVELSEVLFTREDYGPIMLLCCWAKGYQAPLSLVPNMTSAEEACRLYTKRFRIETFFSDQKSRGFHLHQCILPILTPLSLFIATCLASIWIVYLGSICMKEG